MEMIKNLSRQKIYQQTSEIELLNSIKQLAGDKVAEKAVNKYTDANRLYQLSKLNDLLRAGIPTDMAFEAVDIKYPAEVIINAYRNLG